MNESDESKRSKRNGSMSILSYFCKKPRNNECVESDNNSCSTISNKLAIEVNQVTDPCKVILVNNTVTDFSSVSQQVVSRDLFSKAAILCDNDTPKKYFLKRTISTLVRENFNQRKKIKVLNQQVRRQRKNISSLKNVINVLEEKNLLNQDQLNLIDQNFSTSLKLGGEV
ncbi:uncharacterized protein LOC111034558 isoform X4 [Myzus persicae]|uniref:uncharacterized protein LOC111034558 isoform X4 n=1 Tax=Myzus persicae TaxID=13164 RepID=UPI000B932026|nr:uncharacterized protein LOC111034558 isoform X4 [Myzus persicae]